MKKFNLLLISALVALTISAQDAQNVSNGTVYLKDKASSHWYMGIGGGTNVYNTRSERHAGGKFADQLGWMGQLEVGRWNSPVWGARAVIDAGLIKHVATNLPVYGPNGDDHNWVGGHVDLMWDMTNALSQYNPDRVWHFVPYAGIGYMFGMTDWSKPSSSGSITNQNQTLTWNAGIINNFNLSKKVALFVDLGWRVFQGSFDGVPEDRFEWDNMFTATAGVKFGLGGKQEFTPAELMDYNLINDLNSQINRLRSENEQLRKRPESCPDCPEIAPVVEESVFVPNVVFFRIDSYKIDRGQQVSVYNTAEYMKANPNATVKIVAYADKKTGTPAYNYTLSEKRAKAVAKALTDEYGISSNRISVEWKGDTEQPYAENDWNRVAIFFAE